MALAWLARHLSSEPFFVLRSFLFNGTIEAYGTWPLLGKNVGALPVMLVGVSGCDDPPPW